LSEIRKARRVSIVAGLMGCHKATVIRMLEDGRLEGYRIGFMLYVYLDTVKKYQAEHDFVAHDSDRVVRD
jgi:excisionase family DNA binding protein